MPTVLGSAPKRGRKQKMTVAEPGSDLDTLAKGIASEIELQTPRAPVPDAWPFPDSTDPLDALVNAGAARALQVILWQQRFTNPDMSVTIKPADIAKLKACTEYLGVKPTLKIWRRPAIPPTPAIPAQGLRRAVPANPGMPAANFVVVQLVDENGNNIRPVENDEEDNDIRIKHDQMRQLKSDIPGMVREIRSALNNGTSADGQIIELCDAVLKLVGQP